MTPENEHPPARAAVIVLRLPREIKGRYVAAARAARNADGSKGKKLFQWIRDTLDAAAPPISSHEHPQETPAKPDARD